MEIIRLDHLLKTPIYDNKVVATIGEFDGLHIAHQELLTTTLKIAQDKQLKSAVITFYPHPDQVLKKVETESYLLSMTDKEELLREQHFDYFIIIEFTLEIAQMGHRDFVQAFLKNLLITDLVVGFDFHYGLCGLGDCNTINEDADGTINTYIIPEKKYHNQKIGTTLIKKLLKEGAISEVNHLIARDFTMNGIVEHGRGIGRKNNVPTANLKLSCQYPPLKEGVYAVFVKIKEHDYQGICNIGHNISFNYYEELSYEIHLIDVNMDLYALELSVRFIAYLRGEQKFINFEKFKEQIEIDKKKALAILRRY